MCIRDSFPREQDLSSGTGEHGQTGTDRDRVAPTHRTFGRCHTDALVALAAEELRALEGVIAQRAQDGTGSRQQARTACWRLPVPSWARCAITPSRARSSSAARATSASVWQRPNVRWVGATRSRSVPVCPCSPVPELRSCSRGKLSLIHISEPTRPY